MSEPVPFEEGDNSLERFQRRLGRNVKDPLTLRPTRLPRATFNVRRNWGESDSDLSEAVSLSKKSSGHWMVKFFLGALIFFLATAAVAFYVLFYSTNIVSASNIDLEVKGPTQLQSGEELTLETTVRNRNKVTLRDVSLTITYPPGTVDPLEANKDLLLWRESLADLDPGQSVMIGSRAIIYGAQNSNQQMVLKIEYHIPDSNAVFTKEVTYQVLIGSGTLDLTYDLPAEINSGKSFTSYLKITSNAKSVLRQVALKIDYPTGFNFQSADPEPLTGKNIWYLGDLAPGVSRDFEITGNLTGSSEEIKSFKVTVGLDKSGGEGDISTEYGSLFKTVDLKKDFVSVSLDFNNKTFLSPGERLDGTIRWRNNLADKVTNGSLELIFAGGAVDNRSVGSSNGFYNSLTKSIIWDKSTLTSLGLMDPGGGGSVTFNLSVLSLERLPSGAIPPVDLHLIFRGTRITSDQQSESIVSEAKSSFKIGTLAKFTAGSAYSVGPFRNTGPLPPKVGEETTYTVTWSVFNSTNQIKQGRVVSKLPLYVKWLSATSPLDEKVIYDRNNNEIIWDLGTIEPGADNELPTREASFQISITPSLSQVGNPVELVKDISFVGSDALTGDKINLSAPNLNTRLLGDPSYTYGQESVVE
ncbi:MAG TPA: hypothetical protein P5274_01470 [Candidatus Paceibacterota bacterium]|nr:hypothetical protein [Candidatus Paceibacterota bacterium]